MSEPLKRWTVVDHASGVVIHCTDAANEARDIALKYRRIHPTSRVGVHELADEVTSEHVRELVRSEMAAASARAAAEAQRIEAYNKRQAAEHQVRQEEIDRLIKAAEDAEVETARRMAEDTEDLSVPEPIVRRPPSPPDRRRP